MKAVAGSTSNGSELWFCSDHRVTKGDLVQLAADPGRVLVYVEDAP